MSENGTYVTVPAMSDPTDLLTSHEVAERCRVSRQTVWRWGNDGTLPIVRLAGSVRFHRSDVEAFIAAGRTEAAR